MKMHTFLENINCENSCDYFFEFKVCLLILDFFEKQPRKLKP